MPSRRPEEEPRFISFVSGCVAGGASATVVAPLEVVKTRLQSSNSGFPKSPDHWVECQKAIKQGKASLVAKHRHQQMQNKHTNNMAQVPSHNVVAGERGGQTSCRPGVNLRSSSARLLLHHYQLSQAVPLAVRSMSTVPTTLSAAAGTGEGGLPPRRMGIWQCLKFIRATEGWRGWYKGLQTQLIGVVPGRGIYFFTYEFVKHRMNSYLHTRKPQMEGSPFVSAVSGASTNFTVSTLTNPIWLIKTRLQLDRTPANKKLTICRCAKQIYNDKGVLGFWKGVTASYYGMCESAMHWTIFEALKRSQWHWRVRARLNLEPGSTAEWCVDFVFAGANGFIAKFIATSMFYPHEVARTRLRERGTKYRSFWQTLGLTRREEGIRGLWRGLPVHLMRQLPHGAVMMATFDLVSKFLNLKWKQYQLDQLQEDLKNAANDSSSACQKSTPVRN